MPEASPNSGGSCKPSRIGAGAAGTAVPGGVRYGRFRSPAWRYDAYVLLDTDAARVVVTPDDPEAFVAAVGVGAPRE